MASLIIGVLALLAVIFLRDKPSTPPPRYTNFDPFVILALEELDEED